MSTENDLNREKMGHFVPGPSPSIEARIAETEQRLINTKSFLENLADGEHRTQKHIAEMLQHIERELQGLLSERGKKTTLRDAGQEG